MFLVLSLQLPHASMMYRQIACPRPAGDAAIYNTRTWHGRADTLESIIVRPGESGSAPTPAAEPAVSIGSMQRSRRLLQNPDLAHQRTPRDENAQQPQTQPQQQTQQQPQPQQQTQLSSGNSALYRGGFVNSFTDASYGPVEPFTDYRPPGMHLI